MFIDIQNMRRYYRKRVSDINSTKQVQNLIEEIINKNYKNKKPILQISHEN